MSMTASLPPWRADALRPRLPWLAARARILSALRRTLDARGMMEVHTPALQVSPCMEPHLQVFATEWVGARPGDRQPLFLHTSPELAMKRLLAAGSGPIWQLGPVWRNGELGDRHSPEFLMLEWYRPGAPYLALVEDIAALLAAALAAAERPRFTYGDLSAGLEDGIEILTVAEAFDRYTGIDLLATLDDRAAPSAAPLAAAARAAGLHVAADDGWEDVFFRIMMHRIEPQLGIGRPTVLTDYPVHMAALARPCPADPRLAERFEVYVCGVELANAFGELTDAAEQRRRFEADVALREALYGQRIPVDEAFLAALEHGLPETSGIALGVDRLILLATGAPDIGSVLWEPVRIAEG